MKIMPKDYESYIKLLDEIDSKNLPDVVSQLLSEGAQIPESYVLDAIKILERKRRFKEAGKLAEYAKLYECALKCYQKANKKEDAERILKLIKS